MIPSDGGIACPSKCSFIQDELFYLSNDLVMMTTPFRSQLTVIHTV